MNGINQIKAQNRADTFKYVFEVRTPHNIESVVVFSCSMASATVDAKAECARLGLNPEELAFAYLEEPPKPQPCTIFPC